MPKEKCLLVSRVYLRIWMFVSMIALSAQAEVRLPSVLAEHMVVQRQQPVHVWGWASPADAVSVAFRGETKSATADELGRWSVYLAPGEAGGPFQLVVKSTNTITLNDVLVGDVWVASGQSNMELPLSKVSNSDAEIAAAKYPKVRLFQIKRTPAEYPMDDVKATPWASCAPDTVPDSSAVAYFFARDIYKRTGVPVGMIEAYWGGSPAEAWTSLHALSADASLMPIFAERNKMVDQQATTVLRLKREELEYQQALARAKAEGKPVPDRRWHPDFRGWAPGGLFNGMIAPVTPFAIRGVIWYQGETNGGKDRAPLYARLFQTLISDWRKTWNLGDFPFLFVQLANWQPAEKDDWPTLRDTQRQTLALRNTGMAVAIDIGDAVDLHPKNKLDVGLRLALAARAIAYGENIEWSGPLYRQAIRDGQAVRIRFDHATELAAKGDTLKGFELAGIDGKFSPAEAKIEDGTVLVTSVSVTDPVAVRYGWAANPDCNLYNREGLPASPFQAMIAPQW